MNPEAKKRQATRNRVQKYRAIVNSRKNIPLCARDSDGSVDSEPESVELSVNNFNDAANDDVNSSVREENELSQSSYDEEQIYSPPPNNQEGEEQVPLPLPDSEHDAESGSSSEAVDDIGERQDETEEIRRWAIEHHITHSQLDKLLLILRRRLLPNLPKSAKSFLKTSSAIYDIRQIEDCEGKPAQFVYIGIAEQIQACVNEVIHNDGVIKLQINIDGLPLVKSSNMQLWPILCKVVHEPDLYKPFAVAMYAGSAKPKHLNDYLDDFVLEMNDLSANGITVNGKQFEVELQCFICDTPARSMLKCVKGHTGFFSCERCEVRGFRAQRCTVFPKANCPERSDTTFRRQTQREHHNGSSPLLHLKPPLNMITGFILDSMHLFYGVMKKLLKDFWLFGNLHVRLGRRNRMELCRRMEFLRSLITSDFQRKPRSVEYISKWKATEFRFFVLYCGPIVMAGILDKKLHKHFLLLHAACRILCCDDWALTYNKHAKEYLRSFFLVLPQYYGSDSQVMNAHNLIHVADDARNMKCSLTRITAFPFENALGKIKKFVHTGNLPLSQICRRLHEQTSIDKMKVTLPPLVLVLKEDRDAGNVRNHRTILKLKYKQYLLSTNAPNDIVLLENGTILKIKHMKYPHEDPENVTIFGRKWKIKKSLFTYPCDSKFLESWELDNTYSSIRISCPITTIHRKMIIIRLPESTNRNPKTYAMSLLH